MFDVSHIPSWSGGIEALKNFRGASAGEQQEDEESAAAAAAAAAEDDNNNESGEETNGGDPTTAPAAINWADVDEQLRGAVRRLAYAGESMDVLPEGCTFTIAVELRDEAAAPVGYPQPWIPAQPDSQPTSQRLQERVNDAGGAHTTPIRAVEAGPLFMECWVEEGKAKLAFSQNQTSQAST